MSLNTDEMLALRLTADLVDVMCGRVIGDGASRAGDVREFIAHVHGIQHMIMAQSAARAQPDLLRLLGEVIE